MTEDMLSALVKDVTGSYVTEFTTQTGEKYNVNWEAPWKRIDMIPALEEACGEKFPPGDELHTKETNDFLKRYVDILTVMNDTRADINWTECFRRPRLTAHRH